MIKNDRQYRITKAQAEKFAQALENSASTSSLGRNAALIEASQVSLRCQLGDLQAEIAEYELLLNGDFHVVEVESFDELPAALIRSRIAAGLSQRELGERLGMKEQQIQRYEATDYSGASFSTLSAVVKALGVSMREDILVPTEKLSVNTFLNRLEQLGLAKDFVAQRFFPSGGRDDANATESAQIGELIFKTASNLRRVFGWSLADALGGPGRRPMDLAAAGAARFKLPARVADQRLSAYILYAHHMARLALTATPQSIVKPVPRDPLEVANAITATYGQLNLRTALDYVWSLGIAVLPLEDAGAFHGACWRIHGRTVILLKQQTNSEARWMFDLFHELWHAGEEPEKDERTILELPETDPARRKGDEEKRASQFAGNVVLSGRAEKLVSLVMDETGGDIPRFKAALPRVAGRIGASAESLANYLAFRLSLQGENWWGTANNLQTPGEPWSVARDAFLLRCDFSQLCSIDKGLLMRALEESEVTA